MGTYEILEHLSSGGFGEVYRGCNIHNRHEIVAIKIVLAALAHDEVALSLFQQESSALNRVAHDAIVRYKMFTIDPGLNRPCLVMEFVDGPSLGDRLESGPMPESEVLDLLLRLASGLESAHRTEVVHRDLSPDNVILPDGRIDTAKIIDFGIAKMTTPGGRTLIGDKFAGKPGYVAPEQLGAFGGIVTGQADVYSLALVAAAAARGHPLDMGDSVVAAVHSRQRVPDLSGV
ncbi:MAG: serine/threonine protein kinase, partial [Pararhodobacter sp.]